MKGMVERRRAAANTQSSALPTAIAEISSRSSSSVSDCHAHSNCSAGQPGPNGGGGPGGAESQTWSGGGGEFSERSCRQTDYNVIQSCTFLHEAIVSGILPS